MGLLRDRRDREHHRHRHARHGSEGRFEVPGVARDSIQPVGIRITRDGATAFVALGPANRVAVVDTRTLKVQSYILVGQRVWHLALTPEEDLLFTTNGVSNDVTVIDAKTYKAIKSIKVGRYPWGCGAPSPGLTAVRTQPRRAEAAAPHEAPGLPGSSSRQPTPSLPQARWRLPGERAREHRCAAPVIDNPAFPE